jgi:N-acyl-D-amino-acid deacylase
MNVEYIVCNGTAVDGRRAAAYRPDVTARDGLPAEIGSALRRHRRERIIDATDCYVMPGTIEIRNDRGWAMWWSP